MLLVSELSSEIDAHLGFAHVRRRGNVLRPDLLIGEEHVHGIPRFAPGSIEEHVDAGGMAIDETRRFEGHLDRIEVGSPNQDVVRKLKHRSVRIPYHNRLVRVHAVR